MRVIGARPAQYTSLLTTISSFCISFINESICSEEDKSSLYGIKRATCISLKHSILLPRAITLSFVLFKSSFVKSYPIPDVAPTTIVTSVAIINNIN